jgi:hypothetical protein
MDAEQAGKDNATHFLARRTGRLAGSIRGVVRDDLSASVSAGLHGSPVAYARVQERGGTIRPRRGRYLAVPAGPARTAAGVSRYASPRDVPGLRFVPWRGSGMLVKETGKGKNKSIEPWFFLVRSVTLKPRRYLAAAFVTAEIRLRDALASDPALLLGDGGR